MAVAGQLPDALDSVVHAAGVVDLGPVADLTTDAWQSQLAVNLVAPAVLTRLCLPAIRAARGTVVFVNSGAGLVAHPGWSAYAASKFGLRALADSLRAEEQEHGVRVTTVYPGRTATAMQQKVHQQEGKDYDASAWIDPATVVDAILHALDVPADATLTDLTIRPR
jgi:NAD(P)-dependent dehydrogenase (short-subunit alcohol dehydrogenase family)